MYHVDYLSPEYYEPALKVPVPLEEEIVAPAGKVKKEAAGAMVSFGSLPGSVHSWLR